MIQRIQSVFLLLAGLSLIVFLFAPIWQKLESNSGKSYTLTAFYAEEVTDVQSDITYTFIPYCIPGGLAVIAACLALFSIGLYKKRTKQMVIGSINSLLIGGALIAAAYFASQAETNILTGMNDGYQYGLFLPAIAIIFNSLAIRFIKKDEKLVRSMDRLR